MVCSFLYPLDLWRIGHSAELRYLREFERSQYFPAEQLRELALERLKDLLKTRRPAVPLLSADVRRSRLQPARYGKLNQPHIEHAHPRNRHIQSDEKSPWWQWATSDLRPNQTEGSNCTPISFFLSRDRVWSRSLPAAAP